MLKNYFLSKTIYRLLSENKKMRDDYVLLCKEIHMKEMDFLNYKKEDYFDLVFGEKLSNTHTIARIWRAIQEKCPELRGDEWEERQKQGGLIRSEIAENKEIMKQLKLF